MKTMWPARPNASFTYGTGGFSTSIECRVPSAECRVPGAGCRVHEEWCVSEPRDNRWMGYVTRFEDLRAWQRARELTDLVYKASAHPPFARDFAMKNQIRSAALSAMSNIAEGFDRNRNPEFLYLLRVAKSSCGAVRS